MSDTRLGPGETAVLEVALKGDERARMWLEVFPDDYYDHEVYDALLNSLPPGGNAHRLISPADASARDSAYRLFEREIGQ